jgi:nucleoside-specific outer membrane channel protein Tsx
VSCLFDGNTSFKPTWAVETNYYMDLGFLPPSLDYFSISGRLAWYGNKGTDTQPLPSNPANGVYNTAVEFNSEPIRLTMDVSKAIWGPKYSHFVDVWVAYRYWQNKFGLDHNRALACTATLGAVTVSNGSCTESSLYSGITVKF